MFRKSTMLAIAATAALGLAVLTPSIVNAKAGHGGGHGFHGGGSGKHGGGHGMHRRHGGHWGHHHHHRRPHWHVRHHRPIWYARPVVYTGYSAPVVNRCTCLTKEYTPEGAVLFKDVCTNEAAMNPPAEAPQQTGYMQPQQQPQSAYTPSYPPQAVR